MGRRVIGAAVMFVGIFLLIPYIPVLITEGEYSRLLWHRFGFSLIAPMLLPTFLEFLIGGIVAVIGWRVAFRRSINLSRR